MTVTRVTAVVMGSNAISEEKIANASITERHLSNTSVELRHLASSANFTASINTLTSADGTLQANINTVNGNVITTVGGLSEVSFGSANDMLIVNSTANGIATTNAINVNTTSGAVSFNQAYTFPTADGSADQLLSTDGAGQLSFVNLSSIQVPSFLVFGQEGTLTSQTSNFEAKTTNGAQNGQGWRLPLAGTVTHISAQFICDTHNDRDLIVELYKNGSATGKTLTVDLTNGEIGGHTSITNEDFSAGDRLTLNFKHSGSGATTRDHAFTLRILLSS